jgi:hypothetical protein
MVANTGPREDSSAEAERAEGPSAVATMTRLIRSLYASNGSRAAIRGGRDSDLIIWSEMLGAVRSRESETTLPRND